MRKKNLAPFVDQTIFRGQGLFEDEQLRVTRSVRRILIRFRRLPPSMRYVKCSDEDLKEIIEPAARSISERYWSHHDYDNRMKDSEIKNDTKILRRALKICLEEIDSIERPSKVRINAILRRIHEEKIQNQADCFGEVRSAISSMLRATDTLMKKNVKQGDQHVFKTCKEVWELREKLTGKAFRSTWDEQVLPLPSVETKCPIVLNSKANQADNFFLKPDALFVQIFIQAIDKNVKFSTILKDLKKISRQRKKSKDNKETFATRSRF